MSKIIFLDIDGVLNCGSWLYANGPFGTTKGDDKIDPAAVKRFNQIIEQTNAKIVVSSVWRIGETLESMKVIFDKHNIKGEIIGLTPNKGRYRGDQIQYWLDDFDGKIDLFVILDDDSDMGDLSNKLVKTSFQTGLLDEHIVLCVEKLNGNSKD